MPSECYIDPVSGSNITGTGTIGAPYKTISYAYSNFTPGTDGTRFNVKSTGTISTSNTSVTFGSGTPDAPLFIQGYTTAAGDGGVGSVDTGSAALFSSSWNYVHLHDMSVTCQTIAIGIYTSIMNSTIVGDLNLSSSYTKCMANTITGTVSANQGTEIRFCKITHSSGYGITFTGQSIAHHNLILSNSGSTGGILLSGHDSEAVSNSLYASSGASYGIRGDDSSYVVGAVNNLLQGYTTALSNVADVNKSSMWCNSSYGHTTLESFSAEPWYQGSFVNNALAESPFTDAAGGDFSPKNISNVNTGFGTVVLFRGAMSPTISGGGGVAAVHPLSSRSSHPVN